MAFTFTYLIRCHTMLDSGSSWRQGNMDATGSLMILVLKLCSCAITYSDSLKDEKVGSSQLDNAVRP